MAERLGINLNSLEQKEQGHRQAGAKALNYDDIVNQSRMHQYERNNTVRNNMIGVGRGIGSSAYQQLSSAANLQSQREAANERASAQADASNTQMMAGVASAAIMAFALF